MNKKYIFGGFIILVFMSLMGYLFTQTNVSYVSDFEVVKTTDKMIKATGFWVKEKKYDIDQTNNIFSFYMKDENGEEMKVMYKGTIPNNFESATSVVVTGKYQNNYFHAKDILTKCPSKYEEELGDRAQS
ncbi:MAG: cytochrome C biogenesis protein CcmE [Melioribacteraceae bacterium]|nr:MAG: cytochrome C biogenesis protein CcmE [Melioribacteraceae bacterium]